MAGDDRAAGPYGREGREFTLAAVGDVILTRELSTADYPGLAELRERIREADAGFANLEVLLHDYECPPAANSGGTYMRAPPSILDEFDWLGFDLLAAANNHTGDYGVCGAEATMDALDERGWAYAGLGEHLAAAREPASLDTPAGRIALLSCCSSITDGSAAGAQRPDMRGRPGLAPLRLETRYVVPEDELSRVRELSESLGLEAEMERRAAQGFPVPGEDEDGFTFVNVGGGDVQFVAGDEYRVERTVTEDDAEAMLRRVRAASRQADWVLLSVHAHEGEGPRWNEETTPAFLREFARNAVDAGADAVLGHGSHVLRGVEVYEGAPICYSLGDFAMGNETVTRLPPEIYERYDLDPNEALPADLYDARVFEEGEPPNLGAAADAGGEWDAGRVGFPADSDFYESVVALPRWRDGDLDRVEFLPVDLGVEAPRPQRGRPRLAEGERAEAILDRLVDRSEEFGTEVRVEDGVGVVEP